MAINSGKVYEGRGGGVRMWAVRYEGGYRLLELWEASSAQLRLVITEETIDTLHNLIHKLDADTE